MKGAELNDDSNELTDARFLNYVMATWYGSRSEGPPLTEADTLGSAGTAASPTLGGWGSITGRQQTGLPALSRHRGLTHPRWMGEHHWAAADWATSAQQALRPHPP